MKEKILKHIVVALMMIPMSFTSILSVYAVPIDENEQVLYYQDTVYMNDLIGRFEDYIKLRNDGFELNVDISGTETKELAFEISDLSTELNVAKSEIADITNENYPEKLESVHSNLYSLYNDLNALNEDHLERIKTLIVERYLEKHVDTISQVYAIIEQNEGAFKNLDELYSELTELDSAITELKEDFSEANWVRFEQKLINFKEAFDEEINSIKVETANS